MNYKSAILYFALNILCSLMLNSQNPYLPLWEHIPDGEPYVFDDPDNPGKQRIYIYGSHDTRRTDYCGVDLVVWSASTDNLSSWRYDGVIFESKNDVTGQFLNADSIGDLLYAPDIAEYTDPTTKKKTYYLYPNNEAKGRKSMVAKSNRPDGPFKVINWSKDNEKETEGVMGFDPAILIDDDGRVYGYWGIEKSYAAELDASNMATIKPGTQIINDMVSHLHQPGLFRFFEASSIRKIKDKYVFIYSRWTADGDFGLPNSPYTLAYAYSDYPLGPFTYGGTIIDARGRDKDENGNTIYTAHPSGNTHGSIMEINGQWYVFYHRQTGTNWYARQAMVAPITIDVEEGKNGKVTITEGEYTSEGFHINGLDPLRRYSCGIACYYTGPDGAENIYPNYAFSGSYVKPLYADDNKRLAQKAPYDLRINHNPVVNNTNGSIIGYKYFNFDPITGHKKANLTLFLTPKGLDGCIDIMIDSPFESQGGKLIGTIDINKAMPQKMTQLKVSLPQLSQISGKHAIFLRFNVAHKGVSLCDMHYLQFSRR